MKENRDELLVIYTYVAVWGSIGAMTRYYLSTILNEIDSMPLGTFLINSLGCFLLAMIYDILGKLWHHNHRIVVGLGTGFIGAFTSFATFSSEVVKFALDGDIQNAIIYWMIGVTGGFFGAVSGIAVTEKLASIFGGGDE